MTVEEFNSSMKNILISNNFTITDMFGRVDGIYATFTRFEGAVLYIINLMESGRLGVSGITRLSESLEYACSAAAGKAGFRNALVFNIIAEDESSLTILDYIDSRPAYLPQPLFIVPVAVDLTNKTLHGNVNHPYTAVNMREIIGAALGVSNVIAKKSIEPVKSDNIAVFVIILINCVMLALTELNGGSEDTGTLLRFGALEYYHVFSDFEFFRIVTCMFLHAGIPHLVYNTLSLYVFGGRVEKFFGIVRFLAIYLLSGIGGSVASLLFTDGVCVGASGGIFGLIGAVLTLTRFTNQEIGQLSYYSMLIFAIVGIFTGFLIPNVGNAAHIGGFLTGVAVSLIMLAYAKKHRRMFFAGNDEV